MKKEKKELDKKFEDWKELRVMKDEYLMEDLKLPENFWIGLGSFIASVMTIYSTYRIYYNYS